MTPIPLDQIGFRWRDHKSALWWLGVYYRKPAMANQALKNLSKQTGYKSTLLLYFHALPYLIFFSSLGRWVIFYILNSPHDPKASFYSAELLFHAYGIFKAIAAGGVAIILLTYISTSAGLLFGVFITILVGSHDGTAIGEFTGAIVGGILFGVAISGMARVTTTETPKVKTKTDFDSLYRKASRWAGLALIVWLIFTGHFKAAAILIVFVVSATISLLRGYYYPFHLIFIWPRLQTGWYKYHPAAWDDLCLMPFVNLHRLLVKRAEETPDGEAEIERLIANLLQRDEALLAKTILLTRKAGRSQDLGKLDEVMVQLPQGEKGFPSETPDLRIWVSEISRLQTRLNTINRSTFREPTAELLVKEIENFRHRIAGLHEPLAMEFRAAATQWLAIAERQLDEARRGSTRELTPQVFRAGDPVDREQEAFVPRYAVIGELEQQIMLSTGCPGIVLYGRRRMGKSTILRNLTDFLPTDVVTAFFSMQKPHLFASLESAVRAISHEIQKQLPASNIGADSVADLRGFYDFLARCNEQLEADGKRLMLAVDEYENIDAKIGEGVFPLDLLDTIRESIQSHRRITWIFAGSHEIYELKNAAWTSYLVSARTIEVPSFTLAETRLLLTEPLKHSSLWRDNEAKRPRFDASFWGEGGIERIHAEAGGWPHLVQLIVETIVDVLNNEEASKVTPELMERALDKSIVSGQIVLYQLMHDESTLSGEWEYLAAFRKRETQAPPDDELVAASLRRRLLVEEINGEWRLRVPLMARWLKLKGV